MKLYYIPIFIFAGLNLLTHIFVYIGIIRARIYEKRVLRTVPAEKDRDRKSQQAPETVSLIIPARNEEGSLPALLLSLEKQTEQDFELILVNDRSEDATATIMEQFRARYPHKTVTIHLEENPQTVNPKQYALSRGIMEASGELLLFTDADCKISDRWVELMVLFLRQPETDLVFAPVYTQPGSAFLTNYQTFDHIYRYFYTAGCAGMNMATGGFGNNLGVRKTALERIGGYDTVRYTVTEDAALISSIREYAAERIHGLTGDEVAVISTPQPSWRKLTQQELRWSSGAFFSPDIQTRLGYGAVMLFLAGAVISLFVIPFLPIMAVLSISIFMTMFIVALLGGIYTRMHFRNYWALVWPDILFSGFYYLYIDLLVFLKVPISWKGKKLKHR
jgi:cellulose synthase/poly-beta-1,6-N-acetylglucosamine synthase-like glycosyltransferase